jgi:hypothetical protein
VQIVWITQWLIIEMGDNYDYQKERFSIKIVQTLYNTVADKITFLGWAFKRYK